MTNATLRQFGYPDTLITEAEHWAVLLRPQQVTLGALILASKSSATEFSALPPEAFVEMRAHIVRIEQVLNTVFNYQRMNYLMLMMVDPHVHFHVIPRYDGNRDYSGATFQDAGWPGPPRLDHINATSGDLFSALQETLKSAWCAS